MESPNLRQVLQSELIQAMRKEDRLTMMVLRSVLAAISNKEAVPATEKAGAVEPAGADVPRRELTPQEIKLVLLDEVEARRNSAGYLATAGRNEESADMEAQAAILERYLYLT